MLRCILLFALLGIAAVLLIGCSGNSTPGTSATTPSTTKGSARITVKWPSASRMIPVVTDTIEVTLAQVGTSFTTTPQFAYRPPTGFPSSNGVTSTQALTFDNLPLGKYTATASAYATNNTTGATPLATGTTTFAITSNTITQFTVRLGSTIKSLTLTPASMQVLVGQVDALAVTAQDNSGNIVLVTNASLQWQSSIPSYATVVGGPANNTTLAQGVVTGIVFGSTNITVTDTESGAIASAVITVVPSLNYITALTLTPATTQLIVGQVGVLTASAKNSAGGNVPVTNASLSWASSVPAIATVNSSGQVTAVSAGTAVVTATDAVTGASGSATITVVLTPTNPNTVTALTLSPSTPTIVAGQTAKLNVSGTNSAGAAEVIPSSSLSWQAAVPGVATVNATGTITAIAPGTGFVTVTDTDSGASATATITVIADTTVVTMKLTPSTLTLAASQSVTLAVSAYNSAGAGVSVPTSNLVWQSLNPEFVTVTQTGVITGVASGTATVQVIDTATGTVASATVTVP